MYVAALYACVGVRMGMTHLIYTLDGKQPIMCRKFGDPQFKVNAFIKGTHIYKKTSNLIQMS